MTQDKLKPLRPLILVFILVNALLLTGKSWLVRKGVDQQVLIIGNLLLFVVMLISFWMTRKSLYNPNPNVFVRAMYGSFIIKFFVFAITAFVYIMVNKKEVNKPALLACLGLYFIYTFLEVFALIRILKLKKHA